MSIPELWDHQKETFKFAKRRDVFFDTSSAGTGKTPAHIEVIKYRLTQDGSRALVVAPKSLMRSAWANDLDIFAPDLKYSLAYAPDENRDAAFDEDSDVVIINTDALPFLASKGKRWANKKLGKNGILIIDESSWLKNPASSRTKAGMNIAPWFKYRTNLSGTPAPNSVVELWPQVHLLDQGQRLGKRYSAFSRYMRRKVVTDKGSPKWVDIPDAELLSYGLISDITIGHRFDDVMKHVPPMEQRIIYYDLNDKARAVYEELRKKTAVTLDDGHVSAFNAGVLVNKLLQCASGAVYRDAAQDSPKVYTVIDNGRYKLIADLIEARQKVVVFFLWTHQKEEIGQELKRRKISFEVLDSSVPDPEVRNKHVQALQHGELRALLIHPLTGAHGLTLTSATTTIWASPTYNSDIKEQGDARIRRGKQDKPTESIMILARNTRDMKAYEVFSGKKTRMDALNELLSKGLQNE
jgi:SNF2 family DNA or RNA helicase